MFLRSELTVSAMPVPIQSSAGSRVMLANVITATERSIAGGGAPPVMRLVLGRGAASSSRGDLAQVDLHVARRLIAERRRLLERPRDDRVEGRRHAGV